MSDNPIPAFSFDPDFAAESRIRATVITAMERGDSYVALSVADMQLYMETMARLASARKAERDAVLEDNEIDAEVARILAMSDDQIMAKATTDDVAWGRAFKRGLQQGLDIAALAANRAAVEGEVICSFNPALQSTPSDAVLDREDAERIITPHAFGDRAYATPQDGMREALEDVALWKREAADRSQGMIELNLDRAAMGVENMQLREACQAFIDRFDGGHRADTDYVAGLMRAALNQKG